jgi:hypothetical protein
MQVDFKPSEVDFEKRFEKYLDPTFFQHRVCYFSESSFHGRVSARATSDTSPTLLRASRDRVFV